MVTSPLSPGWQAFERLQHSLENTEIVDGGILADEEALTDLVDVLRSGEPSAEEVGRRYHSLRRNRRRKYRGRSWLFEKYSSDVRRRLKVEVQDPAEGVEQDDLLEFVRENVMPVELKMLLRLASGVTYEVIAAETGISPGTLRVQLFRIRSRLRLQAVA